jgi:poly(hydroxyalkanoate) depolymerase family esterase
MNQNFAAAMNRALSATRTSDLTEATRIIQEALSGGENARPDLSARLLPAPPDFEPANNFKPRKAYKGLADTIKNLNAWRKDFETPHPAQEPWVPDGAQFLRRTHKCDAGERSYRLFVPAIEPPRGLIVMLHGCKQTPEDFATGTKMNEAAARAGFAVAYPRQPAAANPSACWNWFRPQDQHRDQGEPAILADITRQLMAEYRLTRDNTFIAGMSAGGAMAAIMGATYPELFSAIGVHSGLAYKAAQDLPGAFAAMRGQAHGIHQFDESRRAAPRLIVFHGAADSVVVPANAQRLSQHAPLGTGEIETSRFTAGGRNVTQRLMRDAEGIPLLEEWLIAGAGHRWSGGNPQGSYTDAKGPDATDEMLRFFINPRRRQAQ